MQDIRYGKIGGLCKVIRLILQQKRRGGKVWLAEFCFYDDAKEFHHYILEGDTPIEALEKALKTLDGMEPIP